MCADAQAGLRLGQSQTPKTVFLAMRPILQSISGLWEFLGIYHEYVCDVPPGTEKTEHTYEQLPSDEKHSAKIR